MVWFASKTQTEAAFDLKKKNSNQSSALNVVILFDDHSHDTNTKHAIVLLC